MSNKKQDITLNDINSLVANEYGFTFKEIESELLSTSLNDVYLIKTKKGKRILRVYGLGLRTLSDIKAEMELLNDLFSKGVNVHRPISSLVSGNHIVDIEHPVGLRHAVLFNYSEGKELKRLTGNQNFQFGANLATFHYVSNESNLKFDKPEYTIDTLLHKSFKSISNHINPVQKSELKRIIKKIENLIEEIGLIKDKDIYGICHGDYLSRNTLWDDFSNSTIIDFDFFSKGYRAYDISHYKWELDYAKHDKEYVNKSWSSFLNGYNSIRRISENEMRLIYISVALFHIFMGSERIKLAKVLGEDMINELFWSRCFEFLKEWEAKEYLYEIKQVN